MCFGKSDPPPAPDYVGAANAQGAANKEAALQSGILSNPNVTTPFGSQNVSYTQDANGYYVPHVTQQLTPTGQETVTAQQNVQRGLANLGNQAIGTVQKVMGSPLNTASIPGVQTGVGRTPYGGQDSGPIQMRMDESGVPQMPVGPGMTAQNAIMARLDPQLQRSHDALNTQLVNQGLRPGTEAYDNAMKLQLQGENDARTQAALQGLGLDFQANQQGFGQAQQRAGFANTAQNQAFSQGLAGQGQGFNQALAAGQFGNTAQQQAMQQALMLRELPLNEITALMSGSQVQLPQFPGYAGQTVAPPPIFNANVAQGQYNQGVYNADQAANSAFFGGLANLGGAFMGLPVSGGGSLGGNYLRGLIG